MCRELTIIVKSCFCANVKAVIRQRRQAQIDSDTRFLAEAIKDAPPGPEPVDKIVAACKAARRRMRREKWGKK